MENNTKPKINTWKIILPLVTIIGFILVFNSNSSTPQYQQTNYSNQALGIQKNPIRINSPTPSISESTIQNKPSNKSIALATSVFSYVGTEKSQLVKKYANGTNDLSLAITNLAIALDRDQELAKKVELAVYAFLLNKRTQDNYGNLYFNGYPCTEDCSGHEAGYKWAEENDIDTIDDCGGNSDSFIEGCMNYVEENYYEEYNEEE